MSNKTHNYNKNAAEDPGVSKWCVVLHFLLRTLIKWPRVLGFIGFTPFKPKRVFVTGRFRDGVLTTIHSYPNKHSMLSYTIFVVEPPKLTASEGAIFSLHPKVSFFHFGTTDDTNEKTKKRGWRIFVLRLSKVPRPLPVRRASQSLPGTRNGSRVFKPHKNPEPLQKKEQVHAPGPPFGKEKCAFAYTCIRTYRYMCMYAYIYMLPPDLPAWRCRLEK